MGCARQGISGRVVFSYVSIIKEGGVIMLTINRPETLNAL